MRTVSENMQTAVVVSVEEDGLVLQFADSDSPSSKHYKYNKSVTFAAGDRVLLLPSGGSYVAAFVV